MPSVLLSLPLVFGAAIAAAPVSVSADPFPSHPLNEWVWVPMPGSICMNGKETGVYIKYGSGTGLGMYLDGGGACFNAETCATVATNEHPGPSGLGGEFSNTDARNPFANFSWVNVPYCTGDVHIGTLSKTFDLKHRDFKGYNNIKLVAERALATWPSPTKFVLTGESAGGFGAAANYDFIRSYWSGVKGLRAMLLDDSGPILDDTAIAPCLETKWRETWGVNGALPAGCPCISGAGNLAAIWNFTMSKWKDDSFGLISSLKDSTISTFFAFGDHDCKNPVVPVGYTKLEAGLKRLAAAGVPSYLIEGTVHTHTGDKSAFYTKTSGPDSVYLYKWVADLLAPGADPGSVIP